MAIHRGARWVATNDDPTRPTDRGLVPGNGAAVAAVRLAVTSTPRSPASPTGRCSTRPSPGSARARPLFVGRPPRHRHRGRRQRGAGRPAGADRLARPGRPADRGARVPAHPPRLRRRARCCSRALERRDLAEDHVRCGPATARVVDGSLVVDGDAPSTRRRPGRRDLGRGAPGLAGAGRRTPARPRRRAAGPRRRPRPRLGGCLPTAPCSPGSPSWPRRSGRRAGPTASSSSSSSRPRSAGWPPGWASSPPPTCARRASGSRSPRTSSTCCGWSSTTCSSGSPRSRPRRPTRSWSTPT